MSLSEWLEESTPDRREVTVCFDRRLLSALVVAKEQLAESKVPGMLGGSDADLEARVLELQDAVRKKERTFVFEGLGWGAWRDLIAKHPPEADQADTFRRAVQLGFMPHAVENIDWNAETFIPAAMAASCIEPGMTIPQAETILRKNPAGVLDRLWAAVSEVNLAGGADPFVGPATAGVSDGVRAIAKK